MSSQPLREGWYPDPHGQPLLRWWNGEAWTYATLPGPVGPRHRTPATAPARRRLRPWVIALGIAVGLLGVWVDRAVLDDAASVMPVATVAPNPAPAPAAPAPAAPVDAALAATVVIRQGTEVGTSVGTAVAVGPDTLLTAAHVVDGGETALISRANGSTLAAEVVELDLVSDLALVRTVQPHGLPVVVVAAGNPQVYEEVRALGSPNGRVQVSMGRVTAVCDCNGDGVEDIETDAAIRHGNSGGPLVNEAGEIVGIVSFMMGDARYGYAVSAAEINAFRAGATAAP